MAEIDSLLSLPGHPPERLERSLRIPAMSPGWKTSLRALLEQSVNRTSANGNAGLSVSTRPPPAWSGFRSLVVNRIDHETASVVSVYIESPDKSPAGYFSLYWTSIPLHPREVVSTLVNPGTTRADDSSHASRNRPPLSPFAVLPFVLQQPPLNVPDHP